jgi:flagellin
MALTVNTNIAALNAQRNLERSTLATNKSLERLSSGLRINNASDDAAGLAISARLGAQVRGLNQAIRNANDGSALLQTAEGALSEITNIVTRIKELSVQSANGTNSASDRSALNAEVQSLISEVTRIATQTKFGSTALLDGSFTGTFQVGVEIGQIVTQSVGNFKASTLAGSVATQALAFEAAVDDVGAANANTYAGVATTTALQISGPKGTAFVRQTSAADDTASYVENSQSAIATSKVINELTSTTGVAATVTAATFTTATGGNQFANAIDIDGTTNTLTVNGQYVIVNLNGGGVAARRQQLLDAINSQVAGVTAAAGSNGDDIVLTAVDGRNISVSASGTGANSVGGEVFGFTTAVATEKVVARGGINLQASGTITSTFANPAQVTGEGTTAASSTKLATLDISTMAGANTALIVVESILDAISSARGDLGAVQNRLASTVANLSVVVEKVVGAQSRILDADFATETAALTRAQILQQAGIAILSQANAAPQSALALLRQP